MTSSPLVNRSAKATPYSGYTFSIANNLNFLQLYLYFFPYFKYNKDTTYIFNRKEPS
jgi:hypothetical protein